MCKEIEEERRNDQKLKENEKILKDVRGKRNQVRKRNEEKREKGRNKEKANEKKQNGKRQHKRIKCTIDSCKGENKDIKMA